MKFVDEATIKVQAGNGGRGMVSFRREKFIPFGGPDGGDGGTGGSVYLAARQGLNTLADFRYQRTFKGDNGQPGGSADCSGRGGEDLEIVVPIGTVVYDTETDETLGDLTHDGERILVAKGGRGGLGNQHFKSSTNRSPRKATTGYPGEKRELRLELKLIADIGIIGVPNAGKSTLLAALTNARPKIAAYPFTTLEPNLGICEVDEENQLVLADIPGLIEGAHLGIGIGHDFLRHIQRTRVLIHLLDGLAEDPVLDFAQINSELSLFDPALALKPQVVALNKFDLPEVQARWPEIQKGLKSRLKKKQPAILVAPELFTISASTHENVRSLIYRVARLLEETPVEASTADIPVYRFESDPKEFAITHTDRGWRVRGEAIERAAKMTYWEHYQSVRRFQRILEALGIDRALREAGVQAGDTVMIDDFELEWQD